MPNSTCAQITGDQCLSELIADLHSNMSKSDRGYRTHFSIEIRPPKTDVEHETLPTFLKKYCHLGVVHIDVIARINEWRETIELVRYIKQHFPNTIIVPHLVGLALSKIECRNIVLQYLDMGIKNIFVIRGDIAQNVSTYFHTSTIDFPYASDLVHEIKRIDSTLCVGVAGYPSMHHEERDFLQGMRNLKYKVDAGADYIITQLFFQNTDFLDFVDRCRLFNIDVPIIPGITHIKSREHIDRISSLNLGYIVPSALLRDMYHSTREVESNAIGEAWLMRQVQDLIDAGEPLVHFYVFNVFDLANPCTRIIEFFTKGNCDNMEPIS